jgi:nucleoside-diphosphate-sugar epimerase
MQQYSLFTEDLDHVLVQTRDAWDDLRGKRIFITGGTGFFGMWLLESFIWANEHLDLDAQAVVLSRNPQAFFQKHPHLADASALSFHQGDVRGFSFPEGEFDFIIHAATDTSAQLNAEQPLALLDTVVNGTRRVLDFARHCGARRFLLTSSGAVYGRQPPGLSRVGEDYSGAPDPMDSASCYGLAKRLAEHQAMLHAHRYGIEVAIARCFAFAGPYLPLDAHFALGNFIRDALRGGPIRVSGDGTPRRSYLYTADLAVWLWTILFRGQPCRPYNVGSDRALSILETAQAVARLSSDALEVCVAKSPDPNVPPARYVPCVKRAEGELGLKTAVPFFAALRKTFSWHQLRENCLATT